jgi:hypothetical protein
MWLFNIIYATISNKMKTLTPIPKKLFNINAWINTHAFQINKILCYFWQCKKAMMWSISKHWYVIYYNVLFIIMCVYG